MSMEGARAGNYGAAGRSGLAMDRITLGFHSEPSEIETVWRELEADGIATLFQSFDWLNAWCATAMRAMGEEPLIVTGTDGQGRVVFIWPMAIRRSMGTSVLTWLGSPIASYNMGLFRRDAGTFAPEEIAGLLRTVAKERPGISAIELTNQPSKWEDVSNPFASLPSRPSGECARSIPLGASFEALCKAKHSTSRRDQFRRKERKVGEFGRVEYGQATTIAARAGYVDAFLAYKNAQLEKIRAPNVFANRAIASFLHRLAAADTRSYACDLAFLKIGGMLTAAHWGFRFKDRYYCFNESLAEGPALRYSPGTLLMRQSVERECGAGTKYFDFGPGPGQHKDIWGPVDVPLIDTRMIIRVVGWLPVTPAAIRAYAKGQVRAHPAVLRLWRDARFHVRGFMGQ